MVVLRWVFVVVLRWVFVVMRSDLWAGGATVLWFVVGDGHCGFVVGRRCYGVTVLWIRGGATVLWFVVGRRPLWFRGCEIGFLGCWGDGVVVCGGATAVVDSWWS